MSRGRSCEEVARDPTPRLREGGGRDGGPGGAPRGQPPTSRCTSGRGTTSARARGRGPAQPGALRDRPGRGLVHDRDHDRGARARPELRPRSRGLHVGGERPRPRGARGQRRRSRPAIEKLASLPLRGRAVHPLRLARRPEPSGPARPEPGVEADPRRGQAPRPERVGFRVQLSNPEIQPAQLALPDFLQAKVPLVTIRRPVAGSPDARRAALRPSGVPAGLPRAERAPGRRVRRQPARRVHGPDDVRLLGRGAHERLPEPFPGLR